MKVVALVSGGKDSCYAMMRCIDYDHEIIALANLLPEDDSVDEMDSYMYQTVGHQIVISYSECMGLPLFRRRIHGSARHKDLCYKENLGDEVEDMYVLLNEVKQKIPSVTAVCSGAIASDYQRLRVESVCSRLNLVSLAYLWKQDQTLLLDEMINKGIVAIIIKVAAMGLNPTKHLGKTIADMQPSLLHLKELYGINVCGEGGEYESLTLDCPLFKNARIVLENFRVIPHSMDTIAPVGILHPLSFYSEKKNVIHSISNSTEIRDTTQEKINIHEVLVVHQHSLSTNDLNTHSVIQAPTLEDKILHISTARGKTFSVGCWISNSSTKDLQEDLEAVLWKIELRLGEDNLGWVNVLYIHLYISDMKAFTLANEVYLRFITEDKCCFGVPSRSTIELPLTQVNLGNAYIEVLVAEDLSKRVLHVQSISCWAPCCIGPYSQATLHKEILYMAGQLGLDPPTMSLCSGGAMSELHQALKNCEAVAESFDCCIASSAIFLLIYCSASLTLAERIELEHRKESLLRKKILESPNDAPSTIFLYILVPNLPKSALLEIKPLLYAPNYAEEEALDITNASTSSYTRTPHYWDFNLYDLNNTCCQKFIISGKICAVAVSIVKDTAAEICSIEDRNAAEDFHCCDSSVHLRIISRFCLYLLHQTLVDGNFSWSDLMSLRIYFSTAFCTDIDMLNGAFSDAFAELSESDSSIHITMESMFTLIPVLGSGRSASMNDLVTCELLASKS